MELKIQFWHSMKKTIMTTGDKLYIVNTLPKIKWVNF